jgi:hypothetical protein
MNAHRMLLSAAVMAGLAAVPAIAHHGWGSYEAGQPLTLTGPIKRMSFENPHGVIRLDVAGKEWEVVLAPPSRMVNRGLEEAMIKVGTTVSVYGYPSRMVPDELRAERITVAGKTTELR